MFRCLSVVIFLLVVVCCSRASDEKAPPLIVQNAAGKEKAFGSAELGNLPPKKIRAKDPHSGVTADYEGVLLADLLRAAGVTLGKELRGPFLATYVLAEAKDGYRVVYSIGEIDPDTGNAQILVAHKKNGDPLPVSEGPYRFVLPQDKRGARWIRQLTRVSVHQLPAQTPAKPPKDGE
jgi:hypothetical protein